MKVAIISDTHDHLRLFTRAVDYLNTIKIDLLLHCGDWDMAFSMRPLAKAKFPVRGVTGNGDADIQKFFYHLQNVPLYQNLQLDLQIRMQDFMLDTKRICVFHGDDTNVNNLIVESQLYDLFCVGHTHQYKVDTVGKTLIVNPGSFVGYRTEVGEEPVYMVIYDTVSATIEKIDLERI